MPHDTALSADLASLHTQRAPASREPMNREHLTEWLEQHGDHLLHSIFAVVRDLHAAEDILQETFMHGLKAIGTNASFEGHANPYTWLWKIAHNLCVDRTRIHNAKIVTDALELFDTEGDLNAPSGLQILERRETAGHVQRALDILPTEYATVLNLCFVQDMKYREIAEHLGLSLGTVQSRIARAREAFQQTYSMVCLAPNRVFSRVTNSRQERRFKKARRVSA